ncbi:MAG: hypothetical protein LM590_08725 [Thermofilum sp.]|nr:hypothetical protein [Thermofilum sp.]
MNAVRIDSRNIKREVASIAVPGQRSISIVGEVLFSEPIKVVDTIEGEGRSLLTRAYPLTALLIVTS